MAVTHSRTLPSNVEAEESLLGAMLLDPDARSRGIDLVGPEDFYLPTHAEIFEAIRVLHHSGSGVDAVTVRDEWLRLSAHPTSVDSPKLISLQTNTPSTANAAYYARAVLQAADARRMLVAVTGAAKTLSQRGDPYEVAEQLIAELAAIDSPVDRSRQEAVTIDAVLERVETLSPWVVSGLLRSDHRATLVAPVKQGKALAVETPVATPDGWSTMGDLVAGSVVFDETGQQCRVVATTPVMLGRPCYRVEFSDKTVLVADGEHEWVTLPYESRQDRRWTYETVTTEHLGATLKVRNGFVRNHAIEVCGPIECPEADLPIDPYVLGAWLGDGTSLSGEFTCDPGDEEIVEQIRLAGYTVRQYEDRPTQWIICSDDNVGAAVQRGLELMKIEGISARQAAELVGVGKDRMLAAAKAAGLFHERRGGRPKSGLGEPAAPILPFVQELRALGVSGKGMKHIPVQYLRAAPWQRLALFQGLMDTDGTVDAKGSGVGSGFGRATCEFVGTNQRLVEDFAELAVSLGIKVGFGEGRAKIHGVDKGPKYRVAFQTDLPIFRLSRKAARLTPLRTARSLLRYVQSVEPVPSVPVCCVQVDSESGCFLAGRSMVPTHNSVLLRQMAMLSAQGLHPLMPSRRIPPVRSLIFDLENPQAAVAETGGRMVTQLRHTLGAQYNPERCKIVNWPQGVDLRSRQVRARFEREIAIHAPDLVCIGPAYKMFDRRSGRHGVESYEEATEGLLRVLDDLRTRYKFALMIETHSGHGDTERAYGSHRWLEWPELCMVMSRKRDDPYKWVLKIEARLSHDWPLELHRGADWPWVGDWGDNRATVPNQPNRANQARLGDEEEF